MKITNISVPSYSTGNFSVAVGDPETYVHINMTEDESDRVRALATDMFLSRQKAIAKDIETARPLMIELQPEQVEEAPAVRLEPARPQYLDEDDIPF